MKIAKSMKGIVLMSCPLHFSMDKTLLSQQLLLHLAL